MASPTGTQSGRELLPESSVSPRSASVRTKPPALDFFAGSGLATEALRSFFRVVWANDNCEKKAATYRANHPRATFDPGSVVDVRGTNLPSAFLSWASFPCQDLSLAGNLKGIDSSRSGLVWHWLRIMDEMSRRPPVVVAENVLGLLSASRGQHYLALHNALWERGYKVGVVVLDAIYWLPHSRPRVFVIGVAGGMETQRFEAEGPVWCHPKAVRRVAPIAKGFVWWSLPKPRTRSKALADLVDFDAPVHERDQSDHILHLVPEAHRARMEATANEDRVVFPGYKRIRNGKQVLELRFDNVAGCLRTPEGGSSRQFLVIHRDGGFETRLLTVRETARLMGVRDSYRVQGTYNDGYKAMGDAVAIPVVRHLARHLLAPLAEGWNP